MASSLTTLSARDMIAALIAGERDPRVLAGLARSRMKAKHDALAEALDGMFAEQHGQIAQILLDQIAFCDARIARLTMLISEQLATIRGARGADADGTTGPGAGTGPGAPVLNAVARLDQVTGLSAELAGSILSESGSPGALPHRGPLRTVRARYPGTRLKQAPRALLRAGMLASCVCGPEARGGRRRVSSGFGHRPAGRARPGGRGSRR